MLIFSSIYTLGNMQIKQPFDEAKTNAMLEQARASARAKLNANTQYRNLMKQAYEGFDPGTIDVDSEINDIVARNLPKKSKG